MKKNKKENEVGFNNEANLFEFISQIMSMDVDVDVEALTEEFDETEQKTDTIGYGDNERTLTYIPPKNLRKRLNKVLGGKYSFVVLDGERVSDPFQRYSKKDDEYYDGNKYIRVRAMLAIPGLGVQIQYGVKETFGYNEANDWKAASTDAFKKCCIGFGIEATYDDNLDDEEDEGVSGGNKQKNKNGKDKNKKGNNKKNNKELISAIQEIEYDDDELEDALEHEITWGKYKDMTCQEIFEEDQSYLEWIATDGKDEDDVNCALITLSNLGDYEDDESDDRNNKKKNKKDKDNKKKNGGSNKNKNDENEDDEEDRQEIIETIKEVFEDDDKYDKVTQRNLIKSVSSNRKNTNGKKKLEELTLKELRKLVEIVLDDEEEEEDD